MDPSTGSVLHACIFLLSSIPVLPSSSQFIPVCFIINSTYNLYVSLTHRSCSPSLSVNQTSLEHHLMYQKYTFNNQGILLLLLCKLYQKLRQRNRIYQELFAHVEKKCTVELCQAWRFMHKHSQFISTDFFIMHLPHL